MTLFPDVAGLTVTAKGVSYGRLGSMDPVAIKIAGADLPTLASAGGRGELTIVRVNRGDAILAHYGISHRGWGWEVTVFNAIANPYVDHPLNEAIGYWTGKYGWNALLVAEGTPDEFLTLYQTGFTSCGPFGVKVADWCGAQGLPEGAILVFAPERYREIFMVSGTEGSGVVTDPLARRQH